VKFESSPQAQQPARRKPGTKLRRNFHEFRFTALDASMLPTFYRGNLLTDSGRALLLRLMPQTGENDQQESP
jgi:hypothetical protein